MKKLLMFGLVLALVLPVMAMAEDRLPSKDAFHLDGRIFGLGYMFGTWRSADDSKATYDWANLGFDLGKGAEVKLGYLIARHHDVGVKMGLGVTSYFVTNKFDGKKVGDTHTSASTDFRLAAYYNYNFTIKGWLMPYVGPYMGLDYASTGFKQGKSKNDSSTASLLFGGEGGIKIFPIKNAFIDLGMDMEGRASSNVSKQDSFKSVRYSGVDLGLGMFAGMGIFFQ